MTTVKDEQRAVLENDRRVRGGTYHQHAESEASATSGRFAAPSKSVVIGSGPIEYGPRRHTPLPQCICEYDPLQKFDDEVPTSWHREKP